MNHAHLREAIRLAVENVEHNDSGPFGAVIVREGNIMGRGQNRVTSTNDPTAHAEVVAIRDACSRLKAYSLVGCEIYTSCEPCPLCLAAIYWSRVDRIFYAATCDDAARAGFRDQDLYQEFARPLAERSIPMEMGLRDEASVAFRAWTRKPDRIEY